MWPKRLSNFLNLRALSFTEVMISTAMLSGIGLVALNVGDSQNLDANFSETDLAIEVLYQNIYLALEDPQACTNTLGGKGTSISNGKVLGQIYKRNGGTLIASGGNDARDLVRLDSIKLSNLTRYSGQNYAEVNIDVTFKKLSKSLEKNSGPRSITHAIPLQIDFDSSGLETCFLPSTETGQTLVCRQIYGTYNEKTQDCKPSFYNQDCRVNSRQPASALCHYTMSKFDAQTEYSCSPISIEPDNSISCP